MTDKTKKIFDPYDGRWWEYQEGSGWVEYEPQTFIVGFTGHRHSPYRPNTEPITNLLGRYPQATVVHGGAKGFDLEVDGLARKMGFEPVTVPPQYKKHPPKVAPLERNKVIVHMSNLLVAYYDGRESGGTYQAIKYATEYGLPILYLRSVDGE